MLSLDPLGSWSASGACTKKNVREDMLFKCAGSAGIFRKMRFRPDNPSYHTRYNGIRRAPQTAFARELYRRSPSPVHDWQEFLQPVQFVPPEDPQYLSIENAPPDSLWMANYKRKRGMYRKKSRRGRFARRRGARSFRSRVTQVLMKKTETKYFDIGVQNVELYHNCGEFITLFPGYTTAIVDWFNPWSKIVKGTNRLNRIGDRITPRGISIKMFLATKQDRPNTGYRVIVALLPKVVAGTITTARFEPFQIPNSGTCANNMILPADHDQGIKFLYDRLYKPTTDQVSNVDGPSTKKERTRVVKLWIKSKRSRDIIYDTTSADIVNKPLAIFVIPYEQYSTLETDNIASVTGTMRMYFKDL